MKRVIGIVTLFCIGIVLFVLGVRYCLLEFRAGAVGTSIKKLDKIESEIEQLDKRVDQWKAKYAAIREKYYGGRAGTPRDDGSP